MVAATYNVAQAAKNVAIVYPRLRFYPPDVDEGQTQRKSQSLPNAGTFNLQKPAGSGNYAEIWAQVYFSARVSKILVSILTLFYQRRSAKRSHIFIL